MQILLHCYFVQRITKSSEKALHYMTKKIMIYRDPPPTPGITREQAKHAHLSCLILAHLTAADPLLWHHYGYNRFAIHSMRLVA